MSRIVLRLVVFCVCDPVGAEHTFKIHGALLYACLATPKTPRNGRPPAVGPKMACLQEELS